MDSVGDLVHLASADPRIRFAAEDRLRAAGPGGRRALKRLLACGGIPDRLRLRAADLLGAMVREEAVATFAAVVPEAGDGGDSGGVDLWTGAVAIAAEGHPDLDMTAMAGRLEELVRGAGSAVPAGADVGTRVERLNDYLFRDLGFRGDEKDYGNILNSYLPDVLDRRLGIPVTLAVLWIAVARRLDLQASGVGLPMHFVARCEGEAGPVFIDAFHGHVLDREGCRRLVKKAAGRDVVLPESVFKPLRAREVLRRMLRNLRFVHASTGNWHGALAAQDRILRLLPLEPGEWHERALLLSALDLPAAAARSLSRALALDPQTRHRPTIEASRRAFQREAARRN